MVCLAHHGIKGQKWGVRRFQNPDGSLTEAGRKRYSKPIDVNSMNWKELHALNKSGDDFVTPKGTAAYRSTTNPNESLTGKKYVSLNKSDARTYESFVADMYPDSEVYNLSYSTLKKMNVAGTKTQMEIMSKLKNEKIVDLWDMSDEDKDILNKPATDPNTKAFIASFIGMGYDAAVDMLDVSIGYSYAPAIILETERLLEQKSKEKIA